MKNNSRVLAVGLRLRAFDGFHASCFEHRFANFLPELLNFGKALGHDILRAAEGRRRIGDSVFGVVECERESLGRLTRFRSRISMRAVPKPGCERLESGVARRLGLRFSLLLKRKINIVRGSRARKSRKPCPSTQA